MSKFDYYTKEDWEREFAEGEKTYTEADLQAAIEKERKECWQRVVESKQHMKANHIDYTVLREAILGKAGLNTDKEGE